MTFETEFDNNSVRLDVDKDKSEFTVNNKKQAYSFSQLDENRYLLRVGHKVYTIDNVINNGAKIDFTLNGQWSSVAVRDEQALLLDRLGFKNKLSSGEGQLLAPMPGKILDILCNEKNEIKEGDPVIILEAMKMENELKSPADGSIKLINVDVGQSVEKNELLLEV
ncbi:MAG TPA: acetyl-CoA carboxylase biotin carboxyl carrier protein subunit, partial [Balneolales bacterium]|nr:acetyl-CoA carboxylase biotin carboxyl carrier protein subunit [Balneolales bacterium]